MSSGLLRGARPRALAIALVVAAALVAIPPARADLTRVGPVDATTGFPAWYGDGNGLALDLCLDGLPHCLASRADLLNNGADGEAFWFAADATAGKMDVHLAVEAAFLEIGQPISFTRSQYQASGLVPGATYRITDPYGQTTCDGAADGRRTRCRIETGGGVNDFATTLTGRVGPFLTWDTFGTTGPGAPPAGFIGDNVTPHRVTGSPTGNNFVRVEGPGINDAATDACPTVPGPIADCAESDLFIVQGKVAPGPAASTDVTAVDLGNVGDPVTRRITYTSLGTQPASVSAATLSGADAGDFTATHGCGSVAPGASCVIALTYTPRPGTASAATLTISDNTLASPRRIPVAGSSLPQTSLSRSRLGFGRRKVGTGGSGPRVLTVRNTGVAPLSVASVSTSSPEFVVDNGCTVAVAPGASCALPVTFRPASAGAKRETLTLVDSTGSHTVALSARGTSPALSSIRGLAYGRVPVGRARQRVIQVTNTGDAVLAISGRALRGRDRGHFRLGGPAVEPCRRGLRVRPGATCNVPVAFAPRARGARAAALVISGDGLSRRVRLFGRGTR